MAKICFPHHCLCGEFSSLNEAFRYLRKKEYGWSDSTLTEIVRYNIFYRDYLREYGIDALIAMVIEDAPELADDRSALNYLRKWVKKDKLSAYDIQCYNIKDKVTILDHTFEGLEDIIRHREIVGKEFYRGFECFMSKDISTYQDIHIGEIYENYPIFDSYDLGDDRTYQNYIFRKQHITEQDMKTAFGIYHNWNFCMVHEQIPFNLLPILYYRGEGDYMLLASNKQ